MTNHIAEPRTSAPALRAPNRTGRRVAALALLVAAVLSVGWLWRFFATPAASAAPPTPTVTVSTPLQKNVEARLAFLGQFAAVERVELRAQVGGTLTRIHFKDGDVVDKGELLFTIDPVPYEIKLNEATAQLDAAKARLDLASREAARALTLKDTDAGSAENVEQKSAAKLTAQAAINAANAAVRDAQFDLDHCKVVAPFKGRIGTHQVSVGNLIAGSRGATSPTTLLATLVSVNPIYLNFDMSESDFLAFQRQREKEPNLSNRVDIALADGSKFDRQGQLDFVDNAIDRSSGTIHARAIVPNKDGLLTPGAFGRVRLALSSATPTLLVPDNAVFADQSDHAVLVVGSDNVIASRKVEVGDLRGRLRVIRSGLMATDRVVVEGVATAAPGSKVSPQSGSIQFDAAEQN
jgi:RND family efflux transporter MFP subunit